MCYCLVCDGKKQCGEETKECTNCSRRVDVDHFLNGSGCRCKKRDHIQKKNTIDKLNKIIGVKTQGEGEVLEEEVFKESSRNSKIRSSRRIEDDIYDSSKVSESATTVETNNNSSAIGTKSSAKNSMVNQNRQFASEAVKSITTLSFEEISADDSHLVRAKSRSEQLSKCQTISEIAHLAKQVAEDELPPIEELVKKFRCTSNLYYSFQSSNDPKTLANLEFLINKVKVGEDVTGRSGNIQSARIK